MGDSDRTFRVVTLDFLADGGDDYPFPDRDRVDLALEEEAPRTGDATAAADGTEQDALAEYLLDNFNETPFGEEDVPSEEDTRIQNLAFRDDTVLSTEDLEVETEAGGDDSIVDSDSSNTNADVENDAIDADLATLYGTPDADVIELTGSNQTVFANGGDDQIFAQSGGNNTIHGNLGADQFWIANGEYPDSPNTINDFTSGEDVIGIAGLGIGFEDLTFTQTDAGALISANDNDLTIVANTPDGFLANEDHFVFA